MPMFAQREPDKICSACPRGIHRTYTSILACGLFLELYEYRPYVLRRPAKHPAPKPPYVADTLKYVSTGRRSPSAFECQVKTCLPLDASWSLDVLIEYDIWRHRAGVLCPVSVVVYRKAFPYMSRCCQSYHLHSSLIQCEWALFCRSSRKPQL